MSAPTINHSPCLVGPNLYVDLRGRHISLAGLDEAERALVDEMIERFESGMDWNEFENYSDQAITKLYASRNVPPAVFVRSTLFRIAQDLASRLGIKLGLVRMPDYRDDLAELIRDRFRSQKEFCQATGLSEDMLSHVLARRKHLSMESLTAALGRIGYSLHIVPVADVPARGQSR